MMMPDQIPIEEMPENPIPTDESTTKEWHEYVDSVEERFNSVFDQNDMFRLRIIELEKTVDSWEFFAELIAYAILGAMVGWVIAVVIDMMIGDK